MLRKQNPKENPAAGKCFQPVRTTAIYPLGSWVPSRATALVQSLWTHMLQSPSLSKDTERSLAQKIFSTPLQNLTSPDAPRWYLKQARAHTGALCLPVALVQLDHFVLQLFRVVWCEAELADVVAAVLVGVVVAELRLHGVGAQQGQSDKRAGQPARNDVISQLQAEVVPAREHQSTSGRAPPLLPPKKHCLSTGKRPRLQEESADSQAQRFSAIYKDNKNFVKTTPKHQTLP